MTVLRVVATGVARAFSEISNARLANSNFLETAVRRSPNIHKLAAV